MQRTQAGMGIVLALALAGLARAADQTNCLEGPAIAIKAKTCGVLAPPTLSCVVPTRAQDDLRQANTNTAQRAANLFSWQQFIALNWPASMNERGAPAQEKPLSAPGPRVWETWKEAYEIYLPDGRAPAAWNTRQTFPESCAGAEKLLWRTSKVSDVVDETTQALPADGTLPATLKDQQGRLVRYEIRLNRTMFDAIVANRWYDGRVQAKATSVTFPPGSQLLKAAWREITDDQAKYFVSTRACVCEDIDVDHPTQCSVRRMGLAGFHLMTKTAATPQWIWSTFEQVDNIRSTHGGIEAFNDPTCPPSLCPINQQTPARQPTQLTREIAIPNRDPVCAQVQAANDNVAALNRDLRDALSHAYAPLGQYDLVNTQWPKPAIGATRPTEFQALPAVLANTTMESFSQRTSTCMGCHAMSRTLNPRRFVSADFSFTLNNAQPRPPHAKCEDVEASESCNNRLLDPPPAPPRNSEVVSLVYNGYELARRTYEIANQPGKPAYVGNKLHCQSCHLHAGADPDAGWWAGSEQRFKGLTGLQNRINQCFLRSMNGQMLCTPGKDCDSNPHMSALVAYIRWLTAQFEAKHPGKTPTSGFPPIGAAPITPDATRGQAVFAQKCAFCHNAEGQGRYVHGYFRPAVWGPDSYNIDAGLGQVNVLAAFLKSNMPYTSGGLLSDQEAWDLATFIDAQPRPQPPKTEDAEPHLGR